MKLECLQRSGAFKFRGAYNCLSRLTNAQRKAGVVAFSSGNHAIGIATAAMLLGCRATVVMPADAPHRKIRCVQRLGARIAFYDRKTDSREEIADSLARESGASVIPSFDHRDVIAGQGTVALEIRDDLDGAGITPDMFICPTGGGGLLAGCALVASAAWPGVTIYPVEPEAFDDMRLSLQAGRLLSNVGTATTICDALKAPQPGALNFEIVRELVEPSLTVPDASVEAAVAYAHEELKLVIEPSGAIALAAVLSGQAPVTDKNVVIVISGGNVDHSVIATAVARSIAA